MTGARIRLGLCLVLGVATATLPAARAEEPRADFDFGCSAVGDPACDVMVAWTFLAAENRDVFRAAVQVDDATWARGRGWALSFGLIALPYDRISNSVLAAISRRSIDEVLADRPRVT